MINTGKEILNSTNPTSVISDIRVFDSSLQSQSFSTSACLKDTFQRRNIAPLMYHELPGYPAIARIGEIALPGFFEAIQKEHPDGYIIGVGVGAVFSLFNCFPDGTVPKGIVCADVNPYVVLAGRYLVSTLNSSQTTSDFLGEYFTLPDEEYQLRIQKLLRQETDKQFQIQMQTLHGQSLSDDTPMRAWKNRKFGLMEGMLPVPDLMLENFSKLKRLVSEGNISINWTDFTNPLFIEAVGHLPEFNSSTNIIYFSSISDYFQPSEAQDHQQALQMYDNAAKPQIFIDAVSSQYHLYFRINHKVPDFNLIKDSKF